jgi:hypothetical protein
MLFVKIGKRVPKLRSVHLFGEPIKCVDTDRYLGVTLDKRLTWSTHIDQVRKKASQRLGTMGPVINRRSDLAIKNGVLLYKQLIPPLMNYVCPVWRYAARSHIKKLRVLQSKCLSIAANSPCYVGNREIHDNLGVSYFSDQNQTPN